MTTMTALVTGVRAARAEAARARAERRARVLATRFGAVRRPLLTIAGLGSVTAAAFLVAMPLGLLVAGVAFFTLEHLTSGE